MKSKIPLLLLLAGLAAACSQTYIEVQVPFRENRVVDFSRYQNVYFIDFVACAPDLVLDFDTENKKAFLEELPFVIDKKITRLDPPYWAMTRALLCTHCPDVEIQYADNVFFRNVFRSHPRSLFFTGKLNLAVSKMGVVKEVKDEGGTRKNIYASVQTWDLAMKVWVIDGDSGQELLKQTFTERYEPGAGTSPEFNYSVMLSRIMGKLGAKLQPRKTLQERYFLQK
jgi:hypothetical protein